MKITRKTLIGTLLALCIPITAFAVQITVPSAPNSGYYLVSTSTGNYVATTTERVQVGTINATSTTATSTFANGINLTKGCFSINGTCFTSSIGSSASTTLLSDNNTFSGNDNFTQSLGIKTVSPQASLDIIDSANNVGFILGTNTGSRNVDTPCIDLRAWLTYGVTYGGSRICSSYSGNGSGAHNLDFYTQDAGSGVITKRMVLTDLGKLSLSGAVSGDTFGIVGNEAITGNSVITGTLTNSSLGQGWLNTAGNGAIITSSTSPTVAYIIATSTTPSSFMNASTTILSATTVCLTADICRTTWPTSGGSGSGTGNIATSSSEVSGRIPFYTSNSATPALLSGGLSSFTFDGTRLNSTYASSTAITSGTYCFSTTCVTTPTISGITLGGNLNALTATNGTLTFSGIYDGSTARTVGLNLASSNVWSASTTFQAQTNMQQASTTVLSANTSYLGTVASGILTGATGLPLTTGVTGILQIINGGTNSSSISSRNLVWFDGTSITATSSALTIGSLISTTTATSTFVGGISTDFLLVSSTTASSTFANGITVKTGCFSVNGVCMTSNTGTVTGVTGTWPIISSSGTAPNITWGGLSTSTAITVGGMPYFTGQNTFGNVATGTASCTTGVSCTSFTVIGSSPSITSTLGTSVDLTSEVTGVLPIANGGTNASALTLGNIWFDGTRISATSSAFTIGSLISTTTATSTFTGGISAGIFNATSTTASSTFQNGIDLKRGCYAVNGVCLSTGSASLSGGSVNTLAYWTSPTALSATGTPTVTAIVATSTTASSTFAGGVSIGTTVSVAQLDIQSPVGIMPIRASNASGNIELESNGNFGVGTTSAYSKLSVAGQIVAQNYIATSSLATSTFRGDITQGDSTGSVAFTLGYNGNVGIASSTPWRKLSVVGTVAMNGLTAVTGGNSICLNATTFDVQNAGAGTCATSAKRFKENILDLSGEKALSLIMNLKPVTFDYKDGYHDSNETARSYGLIAEDVEKVDPALVDYCTDGQVCTLHFEKLTGLLIGAVQALNEKVGEARRSAEENWQWLVIALLGAGFIYQQIQINRLKK